MLSRFSDFLAQRIKRGLVRRFNNLKVTSVAKAVARKEPQPSGAPVVFFKVSSGIDDLSWNSGFHLLASWALRLNGIPVAYFACHSGMSKCVMGTNRDDPQKEMPCRSCVMQSQALYAGVSKFEGLRVQSSNVNWFEFSRDAELEKTIGGLNI